MVELCSNYPSPGRAANHRSFVAEKMSRKKTSLSNLTIFLTLTMSLLLVAPSSWAWTTGTTSITGSPRLMNLSGTVGRTKTSTQLFAEEPEENKRGILDFLSPYETKIPAELRDEIYAAEANTPAAKDRGQRVALYVLIAFVGILCAFFNGFLTELRAEGPDGPGVDLAEAGFDWVVNNPFLGFLFLNKIGGGICLLGGAGAGLLAEAELDTKRINAEKIYEELERRRQARTQKPRKSSKKKKRPGKEAKRLEALSEVIELEKSKALSEEALKKIEDATQEPTAEDTSEQDQNAAQKSDEEKKEGGIFGSIKSFYEQADNMAASQALLLNKKLEDAGIVEKITDETGLKVIRREEAPQPEKQDGSKKNDQ